MFDHIIRNAFVIDGTGAPGFHSDLAVQDGRIAAMSPHIRAEAANTIDAGGLTLAPGFIDAHSHSDIIVEAFPACTSAVEQGITTQVAGMCGISAAPLAPQYLEDGLRILRGVIGGAVQQPDVNGYGFGAYLDRLDRRIGTNMAFLVGHGTLRAATMGFADRRPTQAELEHMQGLVEEAMESGAFGISFGLIYAPGSYCDAEEMIALCKVVAAYGGVMTVHMRSEAAQLVEALEEMLYVVRNSGVRCVISHHKASGGPANWGKTERTLALIERANADGFDVFCDQYPYTASSTGLSTNIPDRMHALGTDKLLALLSSEEGRAMLRPMIVGEQTPRERFQATRIGASPAHPEYNGRMLCEIADALGQDPYELQCDILLDDRLLTGGIFHTMCEGDLKRVMQYRRTMIGTDGLWYPGCGGAHPRAIGTFPRVLGKYVREAGYLPLEEAIRKMTSLPAQVYGLAGKGLIVPGADADLVLFDAAQIIDRASYGDFARRCEGLRYVLIDGKIVAEDAVYTGTAAGRVLRRRL